MWNWNERLPEKCGFFAVASLIARASLINLMKIVYWLVSFGHCWLILAYPYRSLLETMFKICVFWKELYCCCSTSITLAIDSIDLFRIYFNDSCCLLCLHFICQQKKKPGNRGVLPCWSDNEKLVCCSVLALLWSLSDCRSIARRVMIRNLLLAKERVAHILIQLEEANNFTDFMALFSQFGQRMVTLGTLSGDRLKVRHIASSYYLWQQGLWLNLCFFCQNISEKPSTSSLKITFENESLHFYWFQWSMHQAFRG